MAEPGAASPASPPPPVDDVATKSEEMQPTASGNTADTVDPVLSAITGAVNPVADPVQHAIRDPTRDPRFKPGAGQAFFSTERGTRALRPVSQVAIPPIARGRNDPATVVRAARYWQEKYPRECLCLLPTQGWTIEDLWDAEDLHVEDREFCEQILAFISQETCDIAHLFAYNWVHAHPDRVDFTGLRMGNVYNADDPLEIIDQIFIFGEPNLYSRVFLWHVAHIMIVDWIESSKARVTPVATEQMQSSSTMESHHLREGTRLSSTEVSPSDGKNRTKKNRKQSQSRLKKLTALTEPASTVKSPRSVPIVAPTATNQPHMHIPSHRVSSHGHLHPGTSYMPPRNVNIGAMAGPSMLSPNMPIPTNGMRRSNRGAASASWAENNNRVYPVPLQRQPVLQAPPYIPQPFAMGQMVPGIMAPYVPASQVVHYPQMINHQHDPAINARGPMSFPSGVMHNPSVGPAIVHHNSGPHNSSMGDMTNTHYQNQMGALFADPRAPMPPRLNNPPMPQLYDPYSGNNRKFSGGPAYNNMGKKGGPGNFTTQTSRGRKTSNPAGRASQHNSNADLHPNSSRYQDFGARSRQSEDDPNIVGDTVSGCGHTWIGIQNSTVNELWVGDLPADTPQGEIQQMFEQNVKITPVKVVIKTNGFNKAPSHAFVIFASCSDAKTALTINQFNPRLRNGVRPTVSVPRRFYQKVVSPSSGQSEQLDSRNTRGVTRLTPTVEKEKQADDGATVAKGKVSYSPQDVRSGLPKKPVVDPESGEPAESAATTANPGLDRTKRQQKSPTKNSKAKNKRESPLKENVAEKVVKKTDGKRNTVFPLPIAAGGANNTKDSEPNKKANLVVDKPESSATTPTVSAFKEKVAPTMVLAPDTDAVQGKAPARDIPLQSPKHHEMAAIVHVQGNTPVTSYVELSSINEKTTIVAPPSKATGATSPVDPGVNSEEHLKDVDTKVPDAAVKDPSPELADENNSDDEAKNDVSFHSAPEVQSDAGQPDPQSEVTNESLEANEDTPVLPTVAEEGKLDTSEIQQSAPATTTSRGATTDDLTPTQDPAATTMGSTVRDSTMVVETVPTTTIVSAVEASKKSGVSQVQSLHPFAKSKSQSKKEKEAKKKQQKKEADRIARARVEKGKQTNVDADAQAKTELPIDSGTFPIAPDEASEPEAAEIGSPKSPNNKKSNVKQKPKATGAGSVGPFKKHGDENETGKPDGNNATQASSVTRKMGKSAAKQESSTGSGVHALPETTRPPVPTHPANTPKAQASAKNPSAKEVTESRQISSATSTHIEDSHAHLSRRSSTETLVGDNDTALSTSPTNPSHNLSTGTGITEFKAPDEAPKKKKNSKKKKTKTAVAAENAAVAVDTAPAVTRLPDLTPIVHSPTNLNGEHSFEYDPFTSQMSHIDAIRYANENDKTSYFARTNARTDVKKEAGEQGEAQESSQSDDEG
ncbi:hypothetical protein HRS9139_00693 [Pyrenophora teres f. teres]|nr:hypothetical protein HRS9139_00693 [Pyrenophora teres f. teres]